MTGDYLSWIVGAAGLAFLVCSMGRRLVLANRMQNELIENFEPTPTVAAGGGDGALDMRAVP